MNNNVATDAQGVEDRLVEPSEQLGLPIAAEPRIEGMGKRLRVKQMQKKTGSPEVKKPRARKPKTENPVNSSSESDLREVTRHISTVTTAMLWGRAAGRCQFSGCNMDLTRSPVTQEDVNIAQRATFTPSRRRGHAATKG